MRQQLKKALSQKQKLKIIDLNKTPAAILLPLHETNGEYYILFTRRTEKVEHHKGQISFPGGAYEKSDGNLLNTALRESKEEIGLNPELVDVLGELDDTVTTSTGYIISPFVGWIPWPITLTPDPVEVEEIIDVPVSILLNKDYQRQEIRSINGKQIVMYFYHYKNRVIWGQTAKILHQFLDVFIQLEQ